MILWDVDGTLMSAGPAAQVAFANAVEAVVGRHPGEHGVHMSGKTDPQIALEILARMAISDDEAGTHLPGVLASLEKELEGAVDAMRKDGRAHRGVPELLEALANTGSVLMSVLSGNLAANARVKVALFGLDRWLDLDVGAYGSDDPDRTRLVPIAVRRVERRHGWRPDPSQIWVVGDTPADLACARAAGARCLLVATGRFSFEELEDLGADAVRPDLGDVKEALSVLVYGDGHRIEEVGDEREGREQMG